MLHVIGNENCWTSEFTACSAVITILHFGKEKKRKITKTVQQTLIQSWISLPFLVFYNLSKTCSLNTKLCKCLQSQCIEAKAEEYAYEDEDKYN